MNLKRPLYGPQSPRGPSHGRDVKDFVKRTLHRLPAVIPVGENFFPKPPEGFNDTYNAKTVQAVSVLQRFNDIKPTGNMGQETFDVLWGYADAYSRWVYRIWNAPEPKPPVPQMVSPVSVGSIPSALHPTAGLYANWALDWIVPANTIVRAPEAGVVQKLSGHDPNDDTWDSLGIYGWTVYVRTKVGYVYFITHLGYRAPLVVGQSIAVGSVVGKVGDQRYRPDHVHVGVTSPYGQADAQKRILAVAHAPRL